MRVNSKEIFIDDEDEMLAVECALVYLEKEWDFPRWMFLNSEWQEYVQKKVRMKKHLRKLKEKLGYDLPVAD